MRRTGQLLSAAILAALLAAPRLSPGQQISGPVAGTGFDIASDKTGIPDGMVFAEGTRAINEARWADAIAIFTKIAERKSDHADGALYWKAYAQDKLGESGAALETCAALRASYPKSSWLEECGALEIEVQSRGGRPVQPKPEQSDELKLLALNAMMRHDAEKARAEIEDILNDEDASDRLKNGALFLLGQHRPDLTFPEIVRVSRVEGDVRIERRRQNEKASGAEWEKAEDDTPVESGFSLVTGAGRAEIEFENASTIYLAEDSVLTFNDLHTTDNIPYTEIALLSGTLTVHVKPYVAGEVFLVKTPTDDNLMTTYPNSSYVRMTSYVDATAITPEQGEVLYRKGGIERAEAGETLFYRSQRLLDAGEVNVAQSFTEWDKWVAGRVAARASATEKTMREAGLTAPLPGLAEMEGQGKFFDCAPYGTCWEPAAAEEWARRNGAESEAEPEADNGREQHPPVSAAAMPAPSQTVLAQNAAAAAAPQRSLEDYDFFPCLPGEASFRWALDPSAGVSRPDSNPFAYRWAVCHSGYWIHRRRHYVWVVGKRHHHPPVRWVRSGHTVGFVPIHPRDVKGQPPINGKDRMFPVHLKPGISEGPIKVTPEHPVTWMKEAPREFRAPPLPSLVRTSEPSVAAHSVKEGAVNKAGGPPAPGIPISFDHKTGSFTMPQQMMQGGRQVTVNAPISNRSGNLQSHAGGSGGSGGGSHAGGSGGAASGGASHAGGSSGASSSSSAAGGGGSHH